MAARRPRTVPTPTSFGDLGVPAPLVRALAGLGVTTPFPIQAATLPDALAGRDVLGRGRTGSGKTYAFALPLLARLAASATPRRPGRPRALVLAPTRELATQIEASIAPLAAAVSLRTLTVFGGTPPGRQIAALRSGTDIVVACPGRIADHIGSGHASLDAVEITVLDEADHMAELGFLPTVRKLLDQTPRQGQRLFFSATLDAGIDVLVRRYLSAPVTHSVDPATSPVVVPHHMLNIDRRDQLAILVELAAAPGRTLVFARTKRRAKTLTRQLVAAGVSATELHGNLAQGARSRNLQAFADGEVTTLVATDIAARGIHVDDVALVVHADPPAEYKAYLHRSGRTARAGATGTVVTLMTDDQVTGVRQLARQAGIAPTTTRLRPGHELLAQIAPGPRTFVAPRAPAAPAGGSGRPAKAGGQSAARKAGGQSAAKKAGGQSAARKAGGQPGKARSQSAAKARGGLNSATSSTSSQRTSGAAAFSAGSRIGTARSGAAGRSGGRRGGR
ncbi:DEAD/DEAH box helicase [Solwaraspora sp. WMMB335]|uniref:DEAD/DEAH box helicase n=1 Tax=Solwaraspora sp. WMMB335 TaxID=3404118 RepID=UPI003B965211